jgi:predicted nucleic acid-binding protein
MGWGVRATEVHVQQLERFCRVLPDSYEVIQHWRRLVVEHAVEGVKVHDARLAAVMLAYDIQRLVTFNGKDFARYSHIEAVHPQDV